MHRRRLTARAALFFVVGVSAAAHAQPSPFTTPSTERTSVTKALQSSLRLLTLEHLLRMAIQEKTRAELGGPFVKDYMRSARVPRQWRDGDGIFTNYVLHPVQGAASGYIWLDSHPEIMPAFSRDRSYWHSRLRAMAWAAGYSVQFEIGPISEASIGNVGRISDHAGWVDHVVTPTGGFMMMIGEDVVDRFILAKLEQRTGSPVLRAVLRMVATPSRATANVSAMRPPWHRPERPLR